MLARWEEMPLAAQRRAVQGVCSVAIRPTGAGGVLDPARIEIKFGT
jgi:hypothetical protein